MISSGYGRKGRVREKPGEKSGPRLERQERGGALWVGGHPSPTPGPGRPSSELRARLRGSLAERIAVIEEIADDPAARPSDRLRAAELLLRFGLGTSDELSLDAGPDDWTERVRAELLSAIRREGPARFARRLAALAEKSY